MTARIKQVIESNGLFRVIMKDDNGEEWNADVTRVGFDIMRLKDDFIELGYDMNKIQEFEDLIREDEGEHEQ